MERVAQDIEGELRRRDLHGRLIRIASDGNDTPLDRARHVRDYLAGLEHETSFQQ